MSKVKQQQLDSLILNDSIYRQAIINASCQINQIVTPVNLTTGKLYGTDTFYAKGAGTAVSAGTISNTASPALTTAFADKLAGVTLTGTGIVYGYRNIDSANAIHYKNKTASFSVLVRHDVGSAINYTIKVNKANSANVFSAVTQIATSVAISVPSGADTLIKLEGVSMGDCSNGIEIEIIAECGAITTKNFEFSQWQFNEGSVVLPFMAKSRKNTLKECMERYESSYRYRSTPANTLDNGSAWGIANANNRITVMCNGSFKVQKRIINPVITIYNYGGTANKVGNADNSDAVGTSVTSQRSDDKAIQRLQDSGTGFTANALYWFGWIADARPAIA